MAFDKRNWNPGSANGSGAPRIHTYNEVATAVATIVASGYFNTIQGSITTGDIVYIRASNALTIRELTNTAGVITCSSTALTLA